MNDPIDFDLYDIFGLPRPRKLAPEERAWLDLPWRRSARGNRYVNLVFTGVNIVVYPAGNSWAFRIATLGKNKMFAREDGFWTHARCRALRRSPQDHDRRHAGPGTSRPPWSQARSQPHLSSRATFTWSRSMLSAAMAAGVAYRL